MKAATSTGSSSLCCRCLFLVALVALLCCALILPYLLTLGHTLLPYPFHLLGSDQDPLALTEEVSEYRTSLLRFNGPNTDTKVEGVVKLLRAHPKFAKHHSEGSGGGGSVSSALGAPSPPPLHVITVASQWKPGLELMKSTASLFGLEAQVLGMGDKVLVAWGQGLGKKVHYVLEYARTLGPEDMVLFVDAYDCVFMGRPSLEAYHRGLARALVREPKDPSDTGGGGGGGLAALHPDPASPLPPNLLNRRLPTILVSAEPYCMDHLPSAARAIPPHLRAGQRFPCLNSGGYMGPAGDIISWLSAIDWDRHMADDQAGFYEALALSRSRSDVPLVALDHDGEVFLTMLGVDVGQDVLIERGAGWRLKGAPKSAHPVVWHYPSYYKRMSQAVGLVTGHFGTRGVERVQATVALGWGVGILAFFIGCLGGWRWSRGGGGGPTGAALEWQSRSK